MDLARTGVPQVIEPTEEYGCIKDLARMAWTGNLAVMSEVRESAYLK
ncbi:hypothetical protein F383_37175 [Gossypium arboreum]|uniref:Uncharacterized protein n=1 Tax=Gossypium arboreum TaxID=29729 RepID=A0A0B0M768_GOSAR|nr:hypothetical protein F383_37175 [Gossypium arboreum]